MSNSHLNHPKRFTVSWITINLFGPHIHLYSLVPNIYYFCASSSVVWHVTGKTLNVDLIILMHCKCPHCKPHLRKTCHCFLPVWGCLYILPQRCNPEKSLKLQHEYNLSRFWKCKIHTYVQKHKYIRYIKLLVHPSVLRYDDFNISSLFC